MRQIQGAYITGYVTVIVKGNHPELFFQRCMNHGFTVWNVRKTSSNVCEGNLKLSDVKEIRKLTRGSKYKVYFVKKRGYPFLFKRFLNKKPLIIGLLLSILLLIYLSNIIWKVEITGVPKEIEAKISKQLDAYGIHTGAWILSLDSPNQIQQKLVQDVPELLWVGVRQRGTTYYLEGVEKLVVKEEEIPGPRNLVATKKGVIKNMYVANGKPMVRVNDYVEPGDILVSGEIGPKEEDDNKGEGEEKKQKGDLVAAEGDITAKTWYEVNVTVPLKYNYEDLTGNKQKKYYLKIGDVNLPVWGFGNPKFDDTHYELKETKINFLKWELPIHFVDAILSEKVYYEKERTKQEAIEVGVKQAKQELSLQLGPKAKILTEKVLHESIEDGKVKLNLYFTVEENIARVQPINQGD